MNFTRRIRTVLYGDQAFTDTEIDLLHTPALQRLYDLHQLGLTDRVFVDASHTRFSHVIGVMHMTDRIVAAICKNLKGPRQKNKVLSFANDQGNSRHETGLTLARSIERRHEAIRLIALLHDLTHAPFGHTLEDEIQLVEEKHDTPIRQTDSFWRLLAQFIGWLSRESFGSIKDAAKNAPDCSHFCIRYLETFLRAPHIVDPKQNDPQTHHLLKSLALAVIRSPAKNTHRHRATSENLVLFLTNLHFAFRALYYLDVAHKQQPHAHQIPEPTYPVDTLLEAILSAVGSPLTEETRFEPRRDVYCLDIIGNTICADLLDYAQRDSINAGLNLSYDPNRIVENFTIVSHDAFGAFTNANGKVTHPLKGQALRTAIAVVSHKFRPEIVGELISLLQVRYYVYERMLFHPTKCVAGAALGRAIQLIGWREMPQHLRHVGDAVFLHEMMEAATRASELLDEFLQASPQATRITADWIAQHVTPKIPQGAIGVLVSCRKIFDDQLKTVEDIAKAFPVKLYLLRGAHAATNISHEYLSAAERIGIVFNSFSEHFPDVIPETTIFSEQLIERFADAAANTATPHLVTPDRKVNIQKPDIRRASKALLSEFLPTLESMQSHLNAGIWLLERLLARRYPKRIFCLMPRSHTVGHGDLIPDKIAPAFLNPVVRLTAENAIEDRAGLPRGSVVIHCPLAKGPQKLAEVYITDLSVSTERDIVGGIAQRPSVVKLNAIDQLTSGGEGLFLEHHNSIKALERMYASMWRLSVGVCSPHDKKHAELAEVIGKVLGEILTKGANLAPMSNDPTMLHELEHSYRKSEIDEDVDVMVTYPDGQTKSIPAQIFEFSEFLVETVGDVPGVGVIINQMRDAAIGRTNSSPAALMAEAQKAVKDFVAGKMFHATVEPGAQKTAQKKSNSPPLPELGLNTAE